MNFDWISLVEFIAMAGNIPLNPSLHPAVLSMAIPKLTAIWLNNVLHHIFSADAAGGVMYMKANLKLFPRVRYHQ